MKLDNLLAKIRYRLNPPKPDYSEDQMKIWGRNTGFLNEPKFVEAYAKGAGSSHTYEYLAIRWRIHTVCWAAHHAAKLEGDFVECGVFTGVQGLALAHYIDLNATGKRLFLFDTYEGIPNDQISNTEKDLGRDYYNEKVYTTDIYEQVKKNFAPYPNAILVRGKVPETLNEVQIDKVCFLAIDMNIAYPEIEAIKYFWDKLVPGAIVLLDDYGWQAHEPQYEAMNEFAATKGCKILTLPTGQGLLLKPSAT